MKSNFNQRILLMLILIMGALMLCSSAFAAPSAPAPPISIGMDSPHRLAGGSLCSLAFNLETGKPCALSEGDSRYGCSAPVYSCLEFYPDRYTYETVWDEEFVIEEFAEGTGYTYSSMKPSLAFNPDTREPGAAYASQKNYIGGLPDPPAPSVIIYYAFKGNDWIFEEVDSFDVNELSEGIYDTRVSLAFKSDGTACIAYNKMPDPLVDETYVYYSCRSSSWSTPEQVAKTIFPDYELTLVFDEDDNPSIAHAGWDDPVSMAMQFSHKNGSWTTTSVDVMNPETDYLMEYTDLAYGSGPCVTYVVDVLGIMGLKYSCEIDGTWSLQATVDESTEPGFIKFPNLIFHDGNPYIIYDKGGLETVYVAWLDGENWSFSPMPPGFNAEGGLSAILHGDYVWTATSEGLVYGPQWSPAWTVDEPAIDANLGAGYSPHMAFDEMGKGKVVYVSVEDETAFIAYAEETASWTTENVHRVDNERLGWVGGMFGLDIDVAWDESTNPHISYSWYHDDPLTGELWYSYWDEGSSWVNENTGVIIPNPDNAVTSIAIDSEGNPCIVFPKEDGLYFTCKGNSWTEPEFIDDCYNEAGMHLSSLVIKEDGTPCVAYADAVEAPNLTVKCRNQSAPLPSEGAWDEVFQDSTFIGGGFPDLQLTAEGKLAVAYIVQAPWPTPVFAVEVEANDWTVEKTIEYPNESALPIMGRVNLAFGSQPHILAGDMVDSRVWYHTTKGSDGQWHWEQVTPPDILLEDAGLGMRAAAPHIAAKTGLASLHHLYMADADGDGIADVNQDLIGKSVSGHPIRVSDVTDLVGTIEGTHEVTFGPVGFEWDFAEQLDLSGAAVVEGTGYVEVKGIYTEIPGGKTIRLDKSAGNVICILDEPGAAVVRMTENCTGDNEVKITCPGSAGDYDCEDANPDWTISGLNHTAIAGIGFIAMGGGLNSCAILGGIICDANLACSTGQFTLASDTNRCCVDGTCISSADLAVVNVSAPEAILFKDTLTTITVEVENLGLAATGAFNVSLTVQEPYTVISEQSVVSLAMGETTTLTFTFDPVAFDGLIVLEAKADSGEVIPEANEENNLGTFEVFVRERGIIPEEVGEFVDLIVLNVKLSDPAAMVGEELTVTATVLNAGTLDSKAFTVGLYVDSVYEAVIDAQAIINLVSLESTEVTLVLPTLGLPEKSEVIVFADDGRNVIEADEENNTGSIDLQLLGESMTVYFAKTLDVDATQLFNVLDNKGKDLAGVTIQVTYPFEEKIKTETIITDITGAAYFPVTTPGTHSFAVLKPGFYPVYGEFTVESEMPVTLPAKTAFDWMTILYMLMAIIIVGGVAYYFLVIRKK